MRAACVHLTGCPHLDYSFRGTAALYSHHPIGWCAAVPRGMSGCHQSIYFESLHVTKGCSFCAQRNLGRRSDCCKLYFYMVTALTLLATGLAVSLAAPGSFRGHTLPVQEVKESLEEMMQAILMGQGAQLESIDALLRRLASNNYRLSLLSLFLSYLIMLHVHVKRVTCLHQNHMHFFYEGSA